MSVEKEVPEIRFKGFKDEWNTLTLGELGSVATNKRIFIHQTSLIGDVPFYKIGTFGREPKLFISQELFEDYKKRYPFPQKGDLLFSVIGSIGRVVEYTGEDEYFQDSNVVWLKHDGAIVNSFLKQFYSIVEWEGIEGSTIKHLYNRTILGTQIRMPSRKEQTQIGNTFQKLDNLINQHQQKHDKLSNIKKAMLEKMFPKQGETTPEIRFKEFSGDWEEKELDETIESIGTGKSVFISNTARTERNKFAILGSRGVIGYDSNYDYSGNFILTARVGENAGKLYKYSGDVKITDNTVFIKSEGLAFVFYLLTNFDLRRLAFGTGQPLIKASELSGLKLFFPFKKEEQTQIGNYFQKLDALINQHQQQITKLNNIKQACLSKMFV